MTFTTIFTVVGIGISDLILVFRTYVMYRRSRKVLIVLVTAWIVLAIGNVASVLYYAKSPSDIDSISIIPGIPLCLQRDITSRTSLINYVSLLLFETMVVAMTLWQAFGQQYIMYGLSWTSAATQNMTLIFYRDGLLFSMLVLPTTLGNTLELAFGPSDLQILATPLRVLHSILCCRLVIHIREVAFNDGNDGYTRSHDVESKGQGSSMV